MLSITDYEKGAGMPRILMTTLLLFVLGLPFAPVYGAAKQELTPENVAEILYAHVKRIDYRPLLEYSIDPERKRIAGLAQSIETNRAMNTEVRRKADALLGYKVHHIEVHGTVAAVMFTWRYRNEYRGSQPGLSVPSVIENGCEAVLLKEDGGWKLASTRPWVPDNERGSAFLQQQYNARSNAAPRN